MADRAIDRDMSMHTQARVPALPMPDHALVDITVVDAPSVDMPAVDVQAGVMVVVDVRAAAITATRNPAGMQKATPQKWPFLCSLVV
jgi:hypothetical protein